MGTFCVQPNYVSREINPQYELFKSSQFYNTDNLILFLRKDRSYLKETPKVFNEVRDIKKRRVVSQDLLYQEPRDFISKKEYEELMKQNGMKCLTSRHRASDSWSRLAPDYPIPMTHMRPEKYIKIGWVCEKQLHPPYICNASPRDCKARFIEYRAGGSSNAIYDSINDRYIKPNCPIKPIKIKRRHIPKMRSRRDKFRTNCLLYLLDFVKNDNELEIVFEVSEKRFEKKFLQMVVHTYINNEKKVGLDHSSQYGLLSDIHKHNQFVLGSSSQVVTEDDRLIIVYKDPPEHVYLVTPDAFSTAVDDQKKKSEERYNVASNYCDTVLPKNNAIGDNNSIGKWRPVHKKTVVKKGRARLSGNKPSDPNEIWEKYGIDRNKIFYSKVVEDHKENIHDLRLNEVINYSMGVKNNGNARDTHNLQFPNITVPRNRFNNESINIPKDQYTVNSSNHNLYGNAFNTGNSSDRYDTDETYSRNNNDVRAGRNEKFGILHKSKQLIELSSLINNSKNPEVNNVDNVTDLTSISAEVLQMYNNSKLYGLNCEELITEVDENPFLKSIKRNLRNNENNEIIDNENEKVEEDFAKTDKIPKPLRKYFIEFIDSKTKTEMKFIGPFKPHHLIAINNLLNTIAIFFQKFGEYIGAIEYLRGLKLLEEDVSFRISINGGTGIQKGKLSYEQAKYIDYCLYLSGLNLCDSESPW